MNGQEGVFVREDIPGVVLSSVDSNLSIPGRYEFSNCHAPVLASATVKYIMLAGKLSREQLKNQSRLYFLPKYTEVEATAWTEEVWEFLSRVLIKGTDPAELF